VHPVIESKSQANKLTL